MTPRHSANQQTAYCRNRILRQTPLEKSGRDGGTVCLHCLIFCWRNRKKFAARITAAALSFAAAFCARSRIRGGFRNHLHRRLFMLRNRFQQCAVILRRRFQKRRNWLKKRAVILRRGFQKRSFLLAVRFMSGFRFCLCNFGNRVRLRFRSGFLRDGFARFRLFLRRCGCGNITHNTIDDRIHRIPLSAPRLKLRTFAGVREVTGLNQHRRTRYIFYDIKARMADAAVIRLCFPHELTLDFVCQTVVVAVKRISRVNAFVDGIMRYVSSPDDGAPAGVSA